MNNESQSFTSKEKKSGWQNDKISKLAVDIANTIKENTPLSNVLRYALDVAADELVNEIYYKKHPELLNFIVNAGCSCSEAKFINYVNNHSEIFVCRNKKCDGVLEGICSKMKCNKCNKVYNITIYGITESLCRSCTARKLKECTVESLEKLTKINCINEEN